MVVRLMGKITLRHNHITIATSEKREEAQCERVEWYPALSRTSQTCPITHRHSRATQQTKRLKERPPLRLALSMQPLICNRMQAAIKSRWRRLRMAPLLRQSQVHLRQTAAKLPLNSQLWFSMPFRSQQTTSRSTMQRIWTCSSRLHRLLICIKQSEGKTRTDRRNPTSKVALCSHSDLLSSEKMSDGKKAYFSVL